MTTFTKMHTLGNDFVIVDLTQMPAPTTQWVQHVAHRKYGVGCDQLLGFAANHTSQPSFNFRIYNADGSEAEQCGNGALCLAQYLFDHVVSQHKELTLNTHSRPMLARLSDNNQVSINVGPAHFDPQTLPLLSAQQSTYQLPATTPAIEFYALSVGNPHAIIVNPDDTLPDLDTLGSLFNKHPWFPQGVNVSLLYALDEHTIRMHVYERGVGKTLACGSAACAGAIIANTYLHTKNPISIELPGGTLTVNYTTENTWLSGPTNYAFTGTLHSSH